MSSIKNVAVVGGSGNLGPAIVKALQDAGFNITCVTREESKATFPAGIPVKKVKTEGAESAASAKAAFEGQDAVVSVVGGPALMAQTNIVDAAVAAGVKRFIPSEFGINTQKVTGPLAQIAAPKIATIDHLKKAAASNPSFTWTGLSTGMFFDWCLKTGYFPIKFDKKEATIHDSGDAKFSATNLATIGKCVAAILQKPDETANKYLTVAGHILTENQMLKLAEEKAGQKFTVTKVDTKTLEASGAEKLAAMNFMGAFGDLVTAHMHGDANLCNVEEADNALSLLGVPKDDLQATLEEVGKVPGM